MGGYFFFCFGFFVSFRIPVPFATFSPPLVLSDDYRGRRRHYRSPHYRSPRMSSTSLRASLPAGEA